VPGEANIIVVTGGGWVARADCGAWGEVQRGDWLPLLADAAKCAKVVAGVCTGTMLLAHAGIIGSRRAATHHTAWDDLQATGATLVKDRVDDGDLVTSGGVASGIDLALWLVEREFGRDLAERTAEKDGVSPRRARTLITPWGRDATATAPQPTILSRLASGSATYVPASTTVRASGPVTAVIHAVAASATSDNANVIQRRSRARRMRSRSIPADAYASTNRSTTCFPKTSA